MIDTRRTPMCFAIAALVCCRSSVPSVDADTAGDLHALVDCDGSSYAPVIVSRL